MERKETDKVGKRSVWSWIILVLAVIYGVSPVDIVPDVPFIGWVDDFFIILFAALNLLQFSAEGKNPVLSKLAKWIKWLVVLFGVVAVLLLLVFGASIARLLS